MWRPDRQRDHKPTTEYRLHSLKRAARQGKQFFLNYAYFCFISLYSFASKHILKTELFCCDTISCVKRIFQHNVKAFGETFFLCNSTTPLIGITNHQQQPPPLPQHHWENIIVVLQIFPSFKAIFFWVLEACLKDEFFFSFFLFSFLRRFILKPHKFIRFLVSPCFSWFFFLYYFNNIQKTICYTLLSWVYYFITPTVYLSLNICMYAWYVVRRAVLWLSSLEFISILNHNLLSLPYVFLFVFIFVYHFYFDFSLLVSVCVCVCV